MKKWELVDSELAFDNSWFKVRKDTVKLPNGKVLDDFFVWLQGEIAMVVALTENDELILVKQYKHAYGDIIIECPAGMIDPNEDGLTAAKRELEEETGYETAEFEYLGVFADKPTKAVGGLHVYLAKNIQKTETGEQHLDETEEIDVITVPFEKVFDMIKNREIVASDSIAALYLAAEQLGRITIK